MKLNHIRNDNLDVNLAIGAPNNKLIALHTYLHFQHLLVVITIIKKFTCHGEIIKDPVNETERKYKFFIKFGCILDL